MRGEAGVVDRDDMRVGGKGVGDYGSVVRGFASAKVEGFEAPVSEEAVERGRDGADSILEEG